MDTANVLQDSKEKGFEDGFCKLCNKVFRSQNALESHTRSKKHREMEAIARSVGIENSRMVTRSNSKTSESMEMDVQSDEGRLLFCTCDFFAWDFWVAFSGDNQVLLQLAQPSLWIALCL